MICGAIINADGDVVFIDKSTDEDRIWMYHLGWPDEKEIEWAKSMGDRFALVEVKEQKT